MSFTRADYQAVFNFAREQYYWHESTGRGFDTKAALIMSLCEDAIGHQSNFPREARERLNEFPDKVLKKMLKELSNG